MSKIGIEKGKISKKINSVISKTADKLENINSVTPDGEIVGKKKELTENESYFERMINNTRDKNLKLQLKTYKKLDSGNWGVYGDNVLRFQQKLPAARNTIKERREEKRQITAASETFHDADRCTVREKAALERYFNEVWQGGGDPGLGEGCENAPHNPQLLDFVDSIISTEINYAHFTDDFLSDHIHELFEYQRKLRHVELIKNSYPLFYNSLSDEKKVELQTRAESATELTTVLKKHMRLHGLELKRTGEGYTVDLIRDSADRNVRAENKRARQAEYEQMRTGFLRGKILENEVNIARTVTKDDLYGEENAAENIEAVYAPYTRAREALGTEMDIALGEIRKALKVRDEFINKQKTLIGSYDGTQDGDEKSDLKARIARNNKRIRLANKHIDRYRNYLDFCTGRVRGITSGTYRFLTSENHPELLEIVQLRLLANCLENAFVGSEKMEADKRQAIKDADKGGIETPMDEEEAAALQYERDHKDEVQKKKIEDYLKENKDTGMDLEVFYKKAEKYKQRRQESDRYYELKKIGDDKRKAAEQKAEVFAENHGLKKRDMISDRFMEIFNLPLKNEYADKSTLTDDDMTSYDLLAVFSAYEPAKNMPEKLREKVVKAVTPVINEFLSLTPEKLAALKCPENPDPNDPEYWHARNLVYAGQDMSSFLDRLRYWDIPLTDEQYTHMVAVGKVGELLSNDYRNHHEKMADPMAVLYEDERLKGESLTKVYENVLEPYAQGDMEPEDKAVAAKMNTYAREKSEAFKIKVPKNNGKEMGKHTPVVEMSILEAVADHVSMLNSLQMAKNYGTTDPILLYEEKKQQAAGEMKDKSLFESEKKRMSEYYPDLTDEEIEESVLCKKDLKAIDKLFDSDQVERWKKAFGNDSGGSADLRSFRHMMIRLRPLSYDANGSLTEEGRRNKKLIQRDFEDFISGEAKRRNRVLKAIGKELLKINFSEEMFNFDYASKNISKLHDSLSILHCFQNIAKDYPDFFESDAFTEEERDQLRKNFTDSNVYTNYLIAMNTYTSAFGVDTSKEKAEVKIPNDLKTKEEKLNWGRAQRQAYGLPAKFIFEDETENGVAGAIAVKKKRDALYDKKADEIRRMSIFWAKAKSEVENTERVLAILGQKTVGMPESKRKDMMKKEFEKNKTALDALKKKNEDRLKLADEIKKFVYGEIPELSEEAKKLYDSEVANLEKPTVLHAEVADEEDIVFAEPFKGEVKKQKEETGEEKLERTAKILANSVLEEAMGELKEEEGLKEDKKELKKEIKEEKKEIKEEKKQAKRETKAGKKKATAKAGRKSPEEIRTQEADGLAPGTGYEEQDYHNCWACSGAALFNKFMYLQDGNKLTAPVNQFDIRAFEPKKDELKSIKEVSELSGVELDEEGYGRTLEELQGYMGKDKLNFGSIYETADFFMKKRKDFVLNNMTFTLKDGTDDKSLERYETQKAVFLSKVNEVLDTGNLVAFSNGSHYVTITKVEGEMVTVLDSQEDAGQMEDKMHIEELLERNDIGNRVEITWFSKLKTPDEMNKDYPGLGYDEKTGYSYTDKEDLKDGALKLAQTKGICITKADKKLGKGMDGITLSSYIPKTLNPGQENELKAKSVKEEPVMNIINEEKVSEEKKSEEKKEEKKEEKTEEKKKALLDISDKEQMKGFKKRIDGALTCRASFITERFNKRSREFNRNRHDLNDVAGRGGKFLASAMAFVFGDTEEQSWELYAGLTVNNENATLEQKRLKSRAMERVFLKILEFDISKLTLNSLKDTLSDDFLNTMVFMKALFDFHPAQLREYEELMKDKEVGCALSKEQMEELKAKHGFIHTCGGALTEYYKLAAMDNVTEKELDECMTMPEEQLNRNMADKNKLDKNGLYQGAVIIRSIEKIFGFKAGVDAEKYYEGWREKEKLGKEDYTEDAIKAINSRIEKEGQLPKEKSDHDMTEKEAKQNKLLIEKERKEYLARKERERKEMLKAKEKKAKEAKKKKKK